MSMITNPMNALVSLQEELQQGMPVEECELNQIYKMIYDDPNGQQRFSYVRLVDKQAQALSMFVLVEPIKGVPCFHIGYAVQPKFRGKGFGIEAVTVGLKELINGFGRNEIAQFYIEAVVGKDNNYSIAVAEELFSEKGTNIKDQYTNEPALCYLELVKTKEI